MDENITTVQDLIEFLTHQIELDHEVADLPVIWATDDEGNDFHKLDTTRSGVLAIQDIEEYYLEEADADEGTLAFCIN